MPRSSANDTFLVSPAPAPLLPGRDPDSDERTECVGLRSPSDPAAARRLQDDAADDASDHQPRSWAAALDTCT